jgi:hypothetical protein
VTEHGVQADVGHGATHHRSIDRHGPAAAHLCHDHQSQHGAVVDVVPYALERDLTFSFNFFRDVGLGTREFGSAARQRFEVRY